MLLYTPAFLPIGSKTEMKLTGKLREEGLHSFTEKPALKNGRTTPRIWILAADNHLARIYKKIQTHMILMHFLQNMLTIQ